MKIFLIFFMSNIVVSANWTIYQSSDFDDRVGLIYNPVYIDKDDNCWVCINDGVVNPCGVMKISKDSYEVFNAENTIIPNIAINCITQGSNGDM